jgi:outer membrane protein OmpA-like peptidoglycan-associated protein
MNNLISRFTVAALLLLCFSPLFSQGLSKKEFNKAVEEADNSYYYVEDYEKAASQYAYLYNIYPDNCNLAAKLGICYLNIDGKNAEAMKLLEKASSNVVASEKEYSDEGEKAPLDTYLYRAIAYHKNDSLQKAITLYNDAKKRLAVSETNMDNYIDNQIRDCMYAMEIKKKPLTIISKLFAPWLTEYPGACNPVLSKNDSVFVFTVKEGIKTRIFCSYKSKVWERPVEITKQLGGYDRFYSNSITGNGKQLIIYMDDGGDGNLYYSIRRDTTWSKIKSIGKPINTIYWQSHGFITPDGKGMYFTSNKPGGQGELDIWFSKTNADGSWSEPINCGDIINTPYNETTPFYDPETSALIFSSVGHIGMGGYDVFRSVNRNGSWTTPTGMPYAFNSIEENTFFILNNNAPGFITSIYNQNNDTRNIYSIVAQDPADKTTTAMGSVSLQDGLNIDPKQLQISLYDLNNRTQARKINPTDTSSFTFDIKPGDYQIFISHPGYKTDTINLNVPLFFAGNIISLNASLIPDKVFVGDFLSIKNILFEYDSYTLDDEAISNLKVISNILAGHQDLTIEIAGYTDSKGSTAYNTRLAEKRAQAVIDYLAASGIPPVIFVKKAFGKSNFVAVNQNSNGTDNPEGRKYNRRVTFGIVNPKTGVVIRQESLTPERLRNPNSLKYSIVLLKTTETILPGYFDGLIKNDKLFVRPVKTDDVTMYILGTFYSKSDAEKYLGYIRERGLSTAYIANQYELDNASKDTSNTDTKAASDQPDSLLFTIQVKATQNKLNISNVFPGIEGITEIKTADGYYKYLYGEFKTREKAKEALLYIQKSGFEDAFIRQIEVKDLQKK